MNSKKVYQRKYVQGKYIGEWKERNPQVHFPQDAKAQLLIDGSGFIVTDASRKKQYFIQM